MIESSDSNPTPKRLILSLLSAPSLESVEISKLLAWGKLFDIDDAALRMATGRLVRQGLLESTRRGVYAIGPKGKAIAATARSWQAAEQRVGPWEGAWILVHTSHLGRSNKASLRAREQAFRLNGFAEYVTGLWCRPANLVEAPDATRARLLSHGLEPEAVIAKVTDIPGVDKAELFDLWPRIEINRAYLGHICAMQQSAKGLAKLDLPSAARETFLVGEAVIRQVNADPLLPSPMIDTHDRREMIDQMVGYDALGRRIWHEFNEQS